VFGNQDGAVRIRSRRWPQECQTWGLLEEHGGPPSVKEVEFRIVAVVTISVRVPEEYVVGKQDGTSCNRDVGVPEEHDEIRNQDGASGKRA